MKSFFLILFFVFAFFVIKSEADTQWISKDVESNEVDEEVLDNLIDDLMRNNNYKAIKSGNSQCTSIGGKCMNTNNCKNGIIKAGLCSGGNNIKCCILKKTTTNKTTTKKTTVKKNTTNRNAVNRNAVKKNTVKKNTVKQNTVKKNTVKNNTIKKNTVNKCISQKGRCMNPSNCKNGIVRAGLCPGNNVKCCIPKKTTTKKTTVKQNTVKKNTVKKNTVKQNTVKKNTVKKNTVNKCISQKGRCMNPSNCKNGIVRAGLCPGNNVKCCIPRKTTTNNNTGNKNTGNKNTGNKNTGNKNTITRCKGKNV